MIPILEDEFVAEHADNDEIWWNGPDGSGPYTVKETVNGSSATYALREDYWDTSKTFDCTEITVRYYLSLIHILISSRTAILPRAADRSFSNILRMACHSRSRSSSENPVVFRARLAEM